MKNVVNYLKEVKVELAKVSWPKKQDVVKLTMVVLIFSAIVGVYLGVLDFSFTKLLEGLVAR